MSERGADAAPLPGGLPRWVEAPAATVLLILALPLMGLSALAILTTSGRPVLFRQPRVGRYGRLFTLVKLRTMKGAVPGPQITSSGDERISGVGRLLRRTKLDELPELAHVVRGQMAFVGPRPEVPRFVDPDDPSWRRVLAARPGLTDPMTLSLYDEEKLLAAAASRGIDPESFYRDTLLPYKLAGYRRYLEKRDWRADLRVIVATLLALLGHRRARGEAVRIEDLDDTETHA